LFGVLGWLGGLGVVAALATVPANAGEWAFLGSRYQAMGGAGVATVNDSFASYWNPAALGSAKSYDAALNVGATAAVEGATLESIDALADLLETAEVEAIIDTLEMGGTLETPTERATQAALIAELSNLAADGNGLIGNTSVGLGLRWKNYALFSRALAEFAISTNFDDVRIDGIPASLPVSTSTSLLDNESGARVRGLAVAEAGVGYGHTFFDGLVSVGANLKYLRGVAFKEFIGYQRIEDADLSFRDSRLRTSSDSFGLDLGIMSKPYDWLQVGMVARNVNAPKFRVGQSSDPDSRGSFVLEPQVRMGAAFRPFSNDFLIVATDIDLTINKSAVLNSFRSRLWSFGAEVNLPLGITSLAIRGGGYMNTADGASKAFAITAGLGLRVWLLSLDLAGGYSPKSVTITDGGDRFPSRANGSAVLAVRGDF
jgi:hypothetical protein